MEKTYGREGAEIIGDNCQLTMFGGFAPNSKTAEVMSNNLGKQTVLSGSVSSGQGEKSQSLQMIERPLMTSDELKAMPKGSFIVMKTGCYPIKSRLKLFLDWGIHFEEPYEIEERAARKVEYSNKKEMEYAILLSYPPRISKDEEYLDRNETRETKVIRTK